MRLYFQCIFFKNKITKPVYQRATITRKQFQVRLLFSRNSINFTRAMLLAKLLPHLVPKSSRFCVKSLSLLSRQFNSIQTNNSKVLCRLLESNVKQLTFVKLFSDDVQPVNEKGKKKRRRVVSSDEEDDVTTKKRLVTLWDFLFNYLSRLRRPSLVWLPF